MAAAVARRGYPFHALVDPDQTSLGRLGMVYHPTTFLVNGEGLVHKVWIGPLNVPTIQAELAGMQAVPRSPA